MSAFVMRHGVFALCAAFAFPGGSAIHAQGSRTIASHPRELIFQELEFAPPERNAYRHVLPCGVVIYVVEDHDLPLVDVNVAVRTGAYLDPPSKVGLASLTGSQLRAGGTASYTPEEVNEELAFLAATMTSSITDTEGSAGFNCLTKDLDRVFEIFLGMIRTPRFDSARLDLEKNQEIQDLARRNDQTAAIETREWERLLRGAAFFSVDRVTRASLEQIHREDLVEFHKRCFHPKSFLFSVAGDVKTQEILDRVEKALAAWAKEPYALESGAAIPKPRYEPKAGTYLVDKPEVNQGRVSLGHLTPLRNTPDYHALTIMNQILGGGGFTSRITSRVRSDEGLAYTAASRYELGIYYEGIFRAYFQSKSESVAKAVKIVLEEVERIRKEKVSREELNTAVNHALGLMPRAFATPQSIASTLATDEFTGRDPSFWGKYRQKMKALTEDDILRVAREHLHPDQLVLLIVGNALEILKGGLSEEGAQRIPLPDPITLEYPKS